MQLTKWILPWLQGGWQLNFEVSIYLKNWRWKISRFGRWNIWTINWIVYRIFNHRNFARNFVKYSGKWTKSFVDYDALWCVDLYYLFVVCDGFAEELERV